jgi:putative ABC transport system ATP-binding protein
MLIRLEGVEKAYDLAQAAPVAALAGVDLEIAAGEFVAVVGPSGCGKTTLLSVVGLLARPTRGRYLLEGEDVTRFSGDRLARCRGRRLGFIFQAYNLLPRESAWRNVMFPLVFEPGVRADDRRRRALAALADVGLADRARHRPAQLSGGEKQRVAIARALIRDPDLILADEPTGNLDSRTGRDIMELIGRVAARRRATVLLVTHDPALAACAGRTLEMRDGRIVRDTRRS